TLIEGLRRAGSADESVIEVATPSTHQPGSWRFGAGRPPAGALHRVRRRRRRAWAKEETDGLFSPALRSSNVKRGAAKVCLIQECHAQDGIERRLLLGRSSIRVRRVREGDVSFSNDGLRRSPLDGGVLDE